MVCVTENQYKVILTVAQKVIADHLHGAFVKVRRLDYIAFIFFNFILTNLIFKATMVPAGCKP